MASSFKDVPLFRESDDEDETNVFHPPAAKKAKREPIPWRRMTETDAENQGSQMDLIKLDDFFSSQSSVWEVTGLHQDSFLSTSRCTCRTWSKKGICKHTLGMAIRNKFCVAPAAAKNLPVGVKKRKNGRPPKNLPALVRE